MPPSSFRVSIATAYGCRWFPAALLPRHRTGCPTRVTPTSSMAVAVTRDVPESVAPAAGLFSPRWRVVSAALPPGRPALSARRTAPHRR